MSNIKVKRDDDGNIVYDCSVIIQEESVSMHDLGERQVIERGRSRGSHSSKSKSERPRANSLSESLGSYDSNKRKVKK